MSKYYGESEKKFADIFEACKELGNLNKLIKILRKGNYFYR
jgi:SpoVK/Ycf46/Vps4 family AAA+-type ATPase